MSSYRSPLLDRPGAVEADAPDGGVAAHYGAISPEQLKLLAGTAFVDLSHREVVSISGADRLTWLHSLTTQFLEGLAPGVPTEVLILSPQGRVEFAFTGVDDGTTFWAHTEPGHGAGLATWLDRMRFMMRVEVADVTHEWAVIGLPGLTYKLLPRAELAAAPDTHGDPVGLWAWDALRIEAGRVRLGFDTDEKTIPNEVGWISTDDHVGAVHMDKGCYRGQETVARVHNLGRPPRRLVLLHLDGSSEHLPALHSPLILDGKAVGFIGSVARHHELGTIGLGLVKRNVDSSATLIADGVPAAQEVLVDPDIGLHVRPVL